MFRQGSKLAIAAAISMLLSADALALTGLSLSLGAQQFANENSPTSRLDLQAELRWKSNLSYHDTDSGIPTSQANIYFIYESGALGERALDIDSALLRWGFNSGHLWFGRVAPMSEGRKDWTSLSTSAIGASWVQNQRNALEPRVSGWVGAGAHLQGSNGTFLTLAYSPLFFPSFGPRLELSDVAPASGSRFARLPFQYVELPGSDLIPLYARVDLSDLAGLLRQDQVWLSVGRDFSGIRFEAMAWSAPSPNPTVATTSHVEAGSNDANILATAKPTFPRQTFVGAALEFAEKPLPARLEIVREWTSGKWVLSGSLAPLKGLQLGYLNTFESATASTSSNNKDSFGTAVYARNLLWASVSGPEAWKIRPSLRVEHQVGALAGGWIRPAVDWTVGPGATVIAQANVIAGSEGSYFGAWRSLDSVTMGARFVW